MESTKTFDEQRAIELTNIARAIVKDDPISMFASDEDLLIYEHFFIRGMEQISAENKELKQLLSSFYKMVDHGWKFDSELESIKKARTILKL